MSEPSPKLNLDAMRRALDAATEEERRSPQLVQALARAYAERTGGRLQLLQQAIGEWRRGHQFRTDWHNVPEKLMLTVSELSEAMEAYRHLPPALLDALMAGERNMPPGEWAEWIANFEEELADTLIRLLDMCDALDIPIDERVYAKMAKNELRPIKHGKEC